MCIALNPADGRGPDGDLMNRDILKGQWKQLQGRICQRWGRFTEDDLALIAGDRDVLMGKIQEYYGRSHEQARNDLDDWLSIESLE
jgi:uncharacterized protein YjbJ (UPF0337 family)